MINSSYRVFFDLKFGFTVFVPKASRILNFADFHFHYTGIFFKNQGGGREVEGEERGEREEWNAREERENAKEGSGKEGTKTIVRIRARGLRVGQ